MKNITKIASVVAVAFALAQSTQANSIVGAIGFGGNVTWDTSSAGNATQVIGFLGTQVLSDTGTFAAFITPIAPATFTSTTWNLNDPATSIPNFWQAGGFTFTLNSSSITSQGYSTLGADGFVVVHGSGTISGNGFGPQVMSWSFTAQDPKSGSNPDQWTFSASTNSIPDGGATVMLLGIALSGIALLKKKLVA